MALVLLKYVLIPAVEPASAAVKSPAETYAALSPKKTEFLAVAVILLPKAYALAEPITLLLPIAYEPIASAVTTFGSPNAPALFASTILP